MERAELRRWHIAAYTTSGTLIIGVVVFALAAAFGGLAVRAAWPAAQFREQLALRLAVAGGIGFGALGCMNGLGSLYFGSSRGIVGAGILLLAIVFFTARFWKRFALDLSPSPQHMAPWWSGPLTLAFVGVACGAVVEFGSMAHSHPHGGWDAWAIWNMQARFLFGAQIPRIPLLAPAMNFAHSDYPLLLPGLVAAGWKGAGQVSPAIPIVVSLGFTAGTACVMAGAVAWMRTKALGLVAGMVLLSTQAFLAQGAAQYADVPLGFFLVTTVVLLAAADAREGKAGRPFMALAGVTAGLVAWTKNEGFLFLAALGVGHAFGALLLPRAARRDWIAFAVGLGILLLPLLWFKFDFAPPNDLVAGQRAASALEKLRDWSRYQAIGMAYIRSAAIFPIGTVVALGVALGPGYGLGRRLRAAAQSWLTLAAMVCGYFVVYLLTPYDLGWHLQTSLDRLLMQLWPTTLFLIFTALGAPEELLQAARSG